MKRTSTDFIVVHCSATPAKLDWGVEDIRRLHQDAFKWKDVGYHYVIKRDGTVEAGRQEDEIGSHAKGWNHCSVAVCLVGGVTEKQVPENNFTDHQMEALEKLCAELKMRYPKATICGHRDLGANKACPCFETRAWAAEHLLQRPDILIPTTPPK